MESNNKPDKEKTLDKTASHGTTPNVGTGPSDNFNDGGSDEAKQTKEHTGKQTEMGGATGGTTGLPDASEGNDNTSRE